MEKGKAILSLDIFHEYNINGKCSDLEITPVRSTERALSGHKISFLPNENGFKLIYFPGDANGKTSPSTLPDLFFSIRLKNPEFLYYTALNEKNGCIQYFTSTGGKAIENRTILLEGSLFNYLPEITVDQSAKLIVKNGLNQLACEVGSNGASGKPSFQPDLRRCDPGLYTLQVFQNSKEIQRQDVFVDDDLVGKSVFGILQLKSIDTTGSKSVTMDFKSSRESWKFYFISEKDTEEILALKDTGLIVNNNRYSNIVFSFCERPVESSIQGARTYFFETGVIDKNDVFQPQLIPAYEESKSGLNLSKYELLTSGGKSQDEEYFFCVDRKYWSKKDKKHIIPKGQKVCTKVKLGQKIITVIPQVPGPSLKRTRKEIFMYI